MLNIEQVVKKLNTLLFGFTLILIVFFLLADIVIGFYATKSKIMQDATSILKERKEALSSFTEQSIRTLKSIAKSEYFLHHDQNIEDLFLTFSKANPDFMQIRYINKHGFEKIRVDRSKLHSLPYIVPKQKLQNKSNRDYFIDSQTKQYDTVWFSELNLNMEQGKVEIPYKPTVRAILPLQKNGNFDGILIINYFMNEFLEKISHSSMYHLILINKHGDIIKHYNNVKEWSHYSKSPQVYRDALLNNYKEILSKDFVSTSEFSSINLEVPFKENLYMIAQLNSDNFNIIQYAKNISYIIIIAILFILAYFTSRLLISIIKKTYITYTNDIQKAKDIAETANQSKSAFLANMSHEIRTPMNAILGFVHQLSKTETDTNRKQYLNIIKNSGKTLLNIINDILDFSKIESGKLSIEKHPCQLKSLLDETTILLDKKFEEKQINFEYNVATEVPQCIDTDVVRLKQVLLNLLGNALKFTSEKGTIGLDVNYHSDAKVIHFSVRDTGIGIAKVNQEKIFNAFDQEDSSITRKFGGTGLGLSISSRLVSLMGGTLKVESELGNGSTFYFDIPYEQCHKQVVKMQSDSNSDSGSSDPLLSGHVLIVEDNKTNQVLLSIILDDLGITYDIANDGVEAIATYQVNYNVILMDENMPNMDGIEATQLIRDIEREKNFPRMPIIAVTANALSEDRQRFLDASMDEYISKPYTQEDIIFVLKKFM